MERKAWDRDKVIMKCPSQSIEDLTQEWLTTVVTSEAKRKTDTFVLCNTQTGTKY
jgi:hypothetical protein